MSSSKSTDEWSFDKREGEFGLRKDMLRLEECDVLLELGPFGFRNAQSLDGTFNLAPFSWRIGIQFTFLDAIYSC